MLVCCPLPGLKETLAQRREVVMGGWTKALSAILITITIGLFTPASGLWRTRACWAQLASPRRGHLASHLHSTGSTGASSSAAGRGRDWAMSTAASTSIVADSAADLLKPRPDKKLVYAYLHGFLSGPDSYKGRHLHAYLKTMGVDLHLLDLNGHDGYAGIRYSGALAQVADLFARSGPGTSLVLLGSSLGGYVASRYAELHPDQVDKLVLFCPGYDLQSRWPRLFGDKVMEEWKETGYRSFEVRGSEVKIPFAFVEDGRSHPAFPVYTCPALVVHGVKDEVVPVDTALEALDRSTMVREKTLLYLVDDDHGLTSERTLDTACKAIAEFLDIRPPGADRIEVEQKYPLGDGRLALEGRLRDRGAKFKGTVKMTDVYWDVKNGNVMSRANAWLRQRGGIWELKVPAVQGERPNTLATACYREIAGDEDIANWLMQAFPQHPFKYVREEGLESMLVKAGCSVLARYQTTRTKWSLDDFSLDLDEADFSYSLVEIELLCQTQDELPAASQRIGELARSLGLLDEDKAPSIGGSHNKKRPYRGKLEEYIFRTDEGLHAALMEEGIFSSSS